MSTNTACCDGLPKAGRCTKIVKKTVNICKIALCVLQLVLLTPSDPGYFITLKLRGREEHKGQLTPYHLDNPCINLFHAVMHLRLTRYIIVHLSQIDFFEWAILFILQQFEIIK